jgi:hypothetical protein
MRQRRYVSSAAPAPMHHNHVSCADARSKRVEQKCAIMGAISEILHYRSSITDVSAQMQVYRCSITSPMVAIGSDPRGGLLQTCCEPDATCLPLTKPGG